MIDKIHFTPPEVLLSRLESAWWLAVMFPFTGSLDAEREQGYDAVTAAIRFPLG